MYKKPMKISVIIPCYNEEKTIMEIIGLVHQSLNGYDYEIILVDDGSTDNTKIILEENSESYEKLKVIFHASSQYSSNAVLHPARVGQLHVDFGLPARA